MKPQPKNKRIKDPKYLLFIRTKDCLCQGNCQGDIVPAHIYTNGMGAKCHDKYTVPLCWTHHSPPDGLDGMSLENFNIKYALDIELIVLDLMKEYEAQGGTLRTE